MDKTADGWLTRLASELHNRHLTYRQVAELSGIQYSTVQKHLSGSAQYESLWFLRHVCRGTGIPMAYVLFGVDNIEHEIQRIPVLNEAGVADWLAPKSKVLSVNDWLPYPSMFATGLRVFAWDVMTSDLEPHWPVGSLLYVDPELLPDRQLRRLVLARLPNGGLCARWREWLAGEEWLVPESEIHKAIPLDDGVIIGSVIGGVKSVDL